MTKALLYTIFFLLCEVASNAQSVLKLKTSNVAVSIQLLDTCFATADSVKFIMTLTNTSGATQKLLFDKPMGSYPWSTDVSLYQESGQKVKVTPWAFFSSKLYMEQELETFYRELRKGASISHTYYLVNIVRINTKDGSLSKGEYTLSVIYDASLSNMVTFAIK